jgi:transposase-like protein
MDQESKPRKGRRPRKAFTGEFKASAARLVIDEGKSINQHPQRRVAVRRVRVRLR